LYAPIAFVTAIAVALPPPSFAQAKPAPEAEAGATEFNVEQLDALLAPIALYPYELLTQTLMASTYPLEVIAASRWVAEDNNKDLKGGCACESAGERELGSEREIPRSVSPSHCHDER
jgi:hypothetical protein